jgi:hypothetical protein
MTLIERQQPSHWYLRDGRPFHEIMKKDGTGPRPVTLADARKVQALPSVTNVLGVIAKPGLEAWKIEQGILAALTLPRAAGEDLGGFAKRVVADMTQEVEKAADFGSAIHAACELYAREKIAPKDPILWPFFAPWQRWFDENVERVECLERVFVNLQEGYAGRVDLIAKLKGDMANGPFWAVVDFKTQKIKRGSKGEPKPVFYETWPLQLAAYQWAAMGVLPREIGGLVSVVIDSAQPGPVHVRTWDNGMPKEGSKPASDGFFVQFLNALGLWQYVKGYDPTAPVGFCEKPELN